MDFRNRYKNIGQGRPSDVSRAMTRQRKCQDRRDARCDRFDVKRNGLQDCEDDSPREQDKENLQSKQKQTSVADREKLKKEKLSKWRAQKEEQKMNEKKTAKPLFKVCSIHNRFFSPPPTRTLAPLPPLTVSKPKETITGTVKRLPLRTITNKQNVDCLNKKISNQEEKNSLRKPFAPLDHKFAAPKGLCTPQRVNRTETKPTFEISKYLSIMFERSGLSNHQTSLPKTDETFRAESQ